MKRTFWSADWFSALVVVAVFAALSQSTPLQSLERGAYDWGVQLTERTPHPDIAVVAIDDSSIENLGRWPWPRDLHAQLIRKLSQAGAKVIVYAIFFPEPQNDPGLLFLKDLSAAVAQSSLATLVDLGPLWEAELLRVQQDVSALQRAASANAAILGTVGEIAAAAPSTPRFESQAPTATSSVVGALLGASAGAVADLRGIAEAAAGAQPVPDVDMAVLDEVAGMNGQVMAGEMAGLLQSLAQAEAELDGDMALAFALAESGGVVLAQFFVPGEPIGNPDFDLPAYIARNAVPVDNVDDRVDAAVNGDLPLPVTQAVMPIAAVGEQAAAVGHTNSPKDVDGAIRFAPLVVDYFGQYYPSLALLAAAEFLNLTVSDIRVNLGESVELGRLTILTDKQLRMNTFFYSDVDNKPAFSFDTFFNVLSDQVPAAKFKDKIVLVGPTATGVGSAQVTPIAPTMPEVETLAHAISSILNEEFYIQPDWHVVAVLGLFLLVALYLIVALPVLRAGAAASVTLVFAVAMLGMQWYLMVVETVWVPLALPTALLVIGHVLLTTKRFLFTEASKRRVETESAESNKMLGLQYQGQGQLDMAFEKFQKLPVDNNVLGLLYNLGLDFESKRKPAKARAVYEYIAQHDAKFKDIESRIAQARNLENTVILGGGRRGGGAAETLILPAAGAKPTLGRYDVEKELGRGAMGVVYLGRDPKINRVVAIKTLALSDEFEGAELEEAKSRFFREAESAGRLNHPNIVTIFDAGEEHDLAWIAMEFLKGKEMAEFTAPETLLPVADVLALIADCADALDYAHANHVVHRDIKPANVMYEVEEKRAKITDFGIARVTDASKTKTGMVLGTPSFMSPEQLSGKKVDGRSDLFSLGVMMYQLLTGRLPFTGDSMATLMYCIANEPHPPLAQVNPAAPPGVGQLIDRALEKDLTQRYQDGKAMAADVRACLARLSGA